MGIARDLRILYHMARSSGRGETHAERMETFYRGQASSYDQFRERLLHGRRELFAELDPPEGGVWLDMGGGTGQSLSFMGERLGRCAKVYVVDLSPSLLEVARARVKASAWRNVEPVEADVTSFVPPEESVDLVTFSYSLTMIPDWFRALDHARRLLRPGGVVGVADFHMARKWPEPGRARHGWWTRTFWPAWFALDGVFPNPDHLPYLQTRFEPVAVRESRGTVPYMPGFRVPYYTFIGRKRGV